MVRFIFEFIIKPISDKQKKQKKAQQLTTSLEMLDDDESITLAQIETSMIASQIPNDEERFSDYGHCKHAVNVMLELGEEELIKIEENIRKKILKNGESFMQKYDEMRAANEKVKVEYEQHFIELESTYIDTQSKLETELKNSYLNQSKSTEHGMKIILFLCIFIPIFI